MTNGQKQFGELLRQAREAVEMSRDVLAKRVEVNPSYIFRIEKGGRRPSRQVALALGGELGVEGEELNRWLMAAGHAPMALPAMVKAVRTRGARRLGVTEEGHAGGLDAARRARWLEGMGLDAAMIERLIRAYQTADLSVREETAKAIYRTISRAIETLEAPIHTAVIPVMGETHCLLAPPVIQGLLLRVIAEAVESGITGIILVLPPGTVESLYTPLKEALNLASAPIIKLLYAEQSSSAELGDAILEAESLVGNAPFAVLLPDEVINQRTGRTAYPRELRLMIDKLKRLGQANMIAVASAQKSKLLQRWAVEVGSKAIMAETYPVTQLIEKPSLSHPIPRSGQIFGVVGRYLLQPDIFRILHELKARDGGPLQLATALEKLRSEGETIYAFELKADRQDLGAVFEHAGELLGQTKDVRG